METVHTFIKRCKYNKKYKGKELKDLTLEERYNIYPLEDFFVEQELYKSDYQFILYVGITNIDSIIRLLSEYVPPSNEPDEYKAITFLIYYLMDYLVLVKKKLPLESFQNLSNKINLKISFAVLSLVKLFCSKPTDEFPKEKCIYNLLHIMGEDYYENILNFVKKHEIYQCKKTRLVTALAIAAKYGNVKILQVLLKYGYDPKVVSYDPQTPYKIAREYKNIAIIEALNIDNFKDRDPKESLI